MKPISVLASLVLGVCICIASGIIYDEVPYFPIEISRSCAGPVASKFFAALALTSWTVYDWTKYSPWVTLSWFGFIILAIIPDTVSQLGHTFGLGVLAFGVLGLCYEMPQMLDRVLFVGLLYTFRVLAKIYAVLAWETVHSISLSYFLDEWGIIVFIKNRALDIMFGRGAAPQPDTLLVFKIAAIGQWIILFILAHMLLTQGFRPRA